MNTPKLVTLEGHLNFTMDQRYPSYPTYPNYENFETMDGIVSWAKRTAKSAVKIVKAPFKAVGHTVMETGRGLSRGDIMRVFKAPFKGIGHGVMEQYRGGSTIIKATGTLVYDYSCPGAAATGAGSLIPGPQQPFIAIGSTALGLICGAKTTIEAKREQENYNKKAAIAAAQNISIAEYDKKKKNNMYLLAGGAVAIGIGVLTLA